MALEKVTSYIDRSRLLDVDRAKGLAIFLVVFGHLFINKVPAGQEWYFSLNPVIYKFHMSFFMFITGLVMFYTYPRMDTISDYLAYIRKKFIRFIPAYILFAVVVWLGKFLFAMFSDVERPVTGLRDFVNVLIQPKYSHCGSLWYIYVCFIYFMVIPIMLKLVKQRTEFLLLFALVIHFMPATAYFALDQVFEYMFVFLLGGYVAWHMNKYTELIDRYSYLFLTIFTGGLVLAFLMDVPKVMLGLLSLPALHSLVRLKVFERSFFLTTFGKYTFPIYLMNTMAIGVPSVMMRKYGFWDGPASFIVVLVLLVSGLALPILAQKLFISKVPGLRSIIR
jgi:fucose 4-O-acetylase-like acetyltransferase